MTQLSDHADRWLALANAELARIHSYVPPAVLLSVWWSESRGIPGEVNDDSGASGLGQVTPIALQFYNDQNNTLLGMAEMRDTADPVLQARVSTWLLNWNAQRVAGFAGDLPDRDLLLLSLLSYHQGWPAVRKQLVELDNRGLSVSWENLKNNIPVDSWQGKAPTYAYHEKTLSNAERICIEAPEAQGEAASCFDGGIAEPIEPVPPILKNQQTVLIVAIGIVLAGLAVALLSLAWRD